MTRRAGRQIVVNDEVSDGYWQGMNRRQSDRETEPMLKDIARSVRVGHDALPASFVTTSKLPP